MAELTARPLKAAETVFAADSTAFATASYLLWKGLKYGKTREESTC